MEGGNGEVLPESFAAAVAAAAAAAAATVSTPSSAPQQQPAHVLSNYPPAQATHEEVLANRELFNTTLRDALYALGSSLEKVQ